MDKVVHLERFDVHPSDPDSSKRWKLWYRNFTYFLSTIKDHKPNELEVLYLYIGTKVTDIIDGCTDFTSAIDTLKATYVKSPNEIHSRHLLHSRSQQPGETVDGYLLALNALASNCSFKDVTSKIYRDESVRDSFIRGLRSSSIRARLLENDTLDLQTAVKQARALEQAQVQSESYLHGESLSVSAAVKDVILPTTEPPSSIPDVQAAATLRPKNIQKKTSCYNCGGQRHPKDDRRVCPAKDAVCHTCGKIGHYAKVCKSARTHSSAAVLPVATLASASPVLSSTVMVNVFGRMVKGLLDTGSSENFISETFIKTIIPRVRVLKRDSIVSMASSSLSLKLSGYCVANLSINGRCYDGVQLTILPNSCADVILGTPFLRLHESITVDYGGSQQALTVCSYSKVEIPPVELFKNLTNDCRPIATKSRRFSPEDELFIRSEVQNLLQQDIIEASDSPWRAQVVVTSNVNGKKRLVVDFSQTINRFTLPDAYPLPRIEDIVHSIAANRIFSVIDLSKAYYQIEICPKDRPYTAFQAGNELFQFTRIPMGVTNGVSAFQRFMNKFISDNHLKETFAYLDDITVCGRNQKEHDENLKRFMEAASKYNLELNSEKSKFSLTTIDILGYRISNGQLQPDPERLRPLLEYPVPQNIKSLQRCIGLFAYYSKWVSNYSSKIRPLIECTSFPLSSEASEAFRQLKDDIAKSAVKVIDTDLPLQVETDASDHTIAGTLLQSGRPVAFFSRTLSSSEARHHIVEKEAYAIVESVRKWKHFLAGKHFLIITDQRAVSFLFDSTFKGKIKNDKILRWRMELLPFSFDIKHRPGKQNVVADALTRAHCGAACDGVDLKTLHNELVHPGVTRMLHYVRAKNLPFSVEEIRRVTSECITCAKIKPRFYSPKNTPLIRASTPFERLSVDFKGPLPTAAGSYRFILTVIDEYSRFPFAFPCRDISSKTVIKCLTELFSVFGLPAYIHSDRGAAFMSEDLKQYLLRLGIASSRTTPYNPRGNSQCERYNGVIWNAVSLALESRRLSAASWPEVLPDALHSIRSLLCTATNATPHERMFTFERRSVTGCALPTWLLEPGEVLLKRFGNRLLEATPTYAHVRFKDGHEDTVALRHLAPCPSQSVEESVKEADMHDVSPGDVTEVRPLDDDQVPDPEQLKPEQASMEDPAAFEVVMPRRSSRIRKPVDRYSSS